MTKLKVLSGLFILIIFSFLHAQDFYDINTVNEIRLVFTQTNWDQLLDQLYAQGEERLLGTAIINGVTYDSVGVRYKGNSSYSPNRVKNPFNIKLDYVIDDQMIGPYGTIKLANGFSDPSFIRETLGYEVARKYMPASQANYANVYVNNVLIGVYTSVQDIDDYFDETYFNTDDLARIKGINDEMQVWPILGYIDNNASSYTDYYELDSGTDMSSFINFLYFFNTYTNIDSLLNVDRHLWNLAFDNLFVNLDAPINFGHNYYMVEDSNNRFNTVLWDLNMCFGGFTHLLTGANLALTTMQQLNPLLNSTHASYPIINKVLNNSLYKRMYIAHMRTMIEENISNGWIATRGAELQSIVGSSVQADQNFFYTYANFQNNLNNSVSGGGQGGPGQGSTCGITQLMNTRATYLLSHSAFQGVVPTLASSSLLPEIPIQNTSQTFILNTENASSAYLGYRQSNSAKFTFLSMYDDGNHNDGSANDGVFALTVTLSTGNLEYYFYAENASQGMFMPARAENEFLTQAVNSPVSSVVINEITAKNTLYADNFGEMEDWVELYNTSDNPVNIGGMYLCDSNYIDGVTEWTQISTAYPDSTTIAAHGYLVLWFDEDLDQGILHINSKLGGDADGVFLFSSDGSTMLDSYSWTAEVGMNTNNVSIGRMPDGGSVWMLFGAGQTDPSTPGTTNMSSPNSAPTISNIDYSPDITDAQSVISISASVVDEDANLLSVSVEYGIDDNLSNSTVMVANNDVYSAEIGAFALGTQVKFRIKAIDTYQSETISAIYSIIIGYQTPSLFINELMCTNSSTIADENSEYEDWVEIYNATENPVDLAGYYFTDSHYPETGTSLTQIISGNTETIIPAHGFKIIWFDEDLDQGPLHVNTKLGSGGDEVYLIAPDMLTVIDQISYDTNTGLADNISYGRLTDGGDSWTLFGSGQTNLASPGTSNSGSDNDDNINPEPLVTLNLYPNPVKNNLNIQLKNVKTNYKVKIFNVKGQMVKEFNSEASKTVNWDTKDKNGKYVSKGIYFVKISSGEKSYFKKICLIK